MKIIPRNFVSIMSLGIVLFSAPLRAQQTSDLVSTTEFRVCADPANLPQSDDKGQGYENKIAELMAKALDENLTYEWYPMSTGFVRNTLAANKCDVIIGFSAGHELVFNTNPYFTSGYLFITKTSSSFVNVDKLSDPNLAKAKIGVVAGTAPTSHLAKNGRSSQIAPYPLFVDRRYQNPSQNMLDDLDAGVIDVAIIWGPIAGPLIAGKSDEYSSVPLLHETGQPEMFARITMGVRNNDTEWKRKLNSQIRRHQAEITAILTEAGVPLLDEFGKTLLDTK